MASRDDEAHKMADDKMAVHHVDSVLETLGATGRYQRLQMLVTFSPTLAAACQLLGTAFIAMSVGHECSPPSNTSALASLGYHDYDNVTYEQCNIRIWREGRVVGEEACLYGVTYDQPIHMSVISQFDLVCERANLLRLSQTLVILGQGFGAILAPVISDRLGRKVELIAVNVGLMVSGLGVAYAPNYSFFAIAKFFAGAFQQGVMTGTCTFNAELYPTRQRHLNAVFWSLTWALSIMTLPLQAYLCRYLDWRSTAALYCVWNVTLLLQLWLQDESLRWLLANGKGGKAIEVIRRAARMNKVSEERVIAVLYASNPDSLDLDTSCNSVKPMLEIQEQGTQFSESKGRELVDTSATRKLSLLDILKIRKLLLNAMAMWFAWFTTALGYFSIFFHATSLAGNPYLNFFLTATAEVPSSLLFYYALNRVGRRVTAAIPFLVLALGLLVQGIFQSLPASPTNDVIILLGSLLGMVGASGCFGAVFSYTPEMFPTNVRNQALGLSSFMGRFGGMLAPFTTILSDQVKWGPGVLISCCAVLVCVLLKLLPETNGKELPQTVEDLHQWYVNKHNKHGGDDAETAGKLRENQDGGQFEMEGKPRTIQRWR